MKPPKLTQEELDREIEESRACSKIYSKLLDDNVRQEKRYRIKKFIIALWLRILKSQI